MTQFLIGFHYLLAGFGIITRPGMRRYVAIPFLLNMFIFIMLFILLQHIVAEFNNWFHQYLPMWLQWLSVVIWTFFFVSFLLFFIFAFVMVGNLVCAPFNSLLAEKIQYELTGNTKERRGLMAAIKDAPRTMVRQLKMLGFYLPRAMLLLFLFFVPVIQLAAPFIWFIFNAWYMALTYVDYPSENDNVTLQATRQLMAEKRMQSLGMGTGILFGAMIPVINFIVIPASVAAATIYWVTNQRQVK